MKEECDEIQELAGKLLEIIKCSVQALDQMDLRKVSHEQGIEMLELGIALKHLASYEDGPAVCRGDVLTTPDGKQVTVDYIGYVAGKFDCERHETIKPTL